MLGAHPVQEGSGPCKIPNLYHLLWSYGMHLLARDEVNHGKSSHLSNLPLMTEFNFFSVVDNFNVKLSEHLKNIILYYHKNKLLLIIIYK